MISVKFTREATDLLLSAVYVKGERLFDDGADVDHKLLQEGSQCDIHWRIVGNIGGKLEVTKTIGATDAVIASSEIRPKDVDRVSDFTVFVV